tara:strand:- start:14 stop:334 length:321 start_codon:yes stop_codon:yes gene_type:complete
MLLQAFHKPFFVLYKARRRSSETISWATSKSYLDKHRAFDCAHPSDFLTQRFVIVYSNNVLIATRFGNSAKIDIESIRWLTAYRFMHAIVENYMPEVPQAAHANGS